MAHESLKNVLTPNASRAIDDAVEALRERIFQTLHVRYAGYSVITHQAVWPVITEAFATEALEWSDAVSHVAHKRSAIEASESRPAGDKVGLTW